MANFFVQLLIGFLGSSLAVFFALWIERHRLPSLQISISEKANSDTTYPAGHPRAGERWKYFRVVVRNRPFPSLFSWIPRQTAEGCRPKIEFERTDASGAKCTMQGRWTNTPDLAHLGGNIVLKLLYPDLVAIPVNEEELLDVVVKHELDKEAYGWNHESYIHDWKNKAMKLDRGDFMVSITISTQNGVTFKQRFALRVADTIEETHLTRC